MTSATEEISTPLLIAGAERPGAAGTFPVHDPARVGAVIGHAAAASADDALDAVAAAHDAWPSWAALTAAERTVTVLKALDGLGADAEHLLYAVSHHVVRVVLNGFDVKFVLSVGDGLTVRRSLTCGIAAGRVGRASGQSYRP